VYCDNLLPSVSRERYEKVFREFEAWCNRKKVKQITEEVVLVYIGGWKSTSSRKKYRTRKRILSRVQMKSWAE
jgi:hypothetical protein